MTRKELEQAAIDYLGKAFKGSGSSSTRSDVMQAAVAIVLAPDSKAE